MRLDFPADYGSIIKMVKQIDPIKYSKTRNYTNGAVTYLSPYISRGVISTKIVFEYVKLKGYKFSEIETFLKELCWRDYFQRVGQVKDLNQDIKQPQHPILNTEIPKQIVNADTGISGIDQAIKQLYANGYMHNHCRMYTASVVCNIAKSHWLHPAKWMYYHLLDGDWASNACSWQWVAGANSNKKYFVNQENINKFTGTNQNQTFLDKSYANIEEIEVPSQLFTTSTLYFETKLPKFEILELIDELPTYIYNYYNLDPKWHENEIGNRVLLLEPNFFEAYPVSEKCIDFMLSLSKNISQLKVYIGSFDSLVKNHNLKTIHFKEHPLNIGYVGIEEPRDWISEKVTGYHPSFFSYWKKVEKQLKNEIE
jgi:deoxyribodipyrimidine photo-lyase